MLSIVEDNEFTEKERNNIDIARGAHFHTYSYELLADLMVKGGFSPENIYQ